MKQNNWFKGLNERLTCSFKTALPDNEATEIVNLYPLSKGQLKKISFKTFKGFVSELDRANKNCKKHKCQTEIRIMLPVRGKLK